MAEYKTGEVFNHKYFSDTFNLDFNFFKYLNKLDLKKLNNNISISYSNIEIDKLKIKKNVDICILNDTYDIYNFLQKLIEAINTSINNNTKLKIFIRNPEIFNFVYSLKMLSHCNPYCKTPLEILKNKSELIKLRIKTDTNNKEIVSKINYYFSDEFDNSNLENYDERIRNEFECFHNFLNKLYNPIVSSLAINVMNFMEDQISADTYHNIPSINQIHNNNIASVFLNLLNLSDTEIKFDETIEKTLIITDIIAKKFNKLIANLLLVIILLNNINLTTIIPVIKNNSINITEFENNKAITQIINELRNYYNSDKIFELLSSLYLIQKYNQVEYEEEVLKVNKIGINKNMNIFVNNFKFPNHLFREKHALNIFTNMMMDGIVNVETTLSDEMIKA